MGCDIHLHTEIKVRGRWLHYSQPEVDRCYILFTKMAGVRAYNDEIEPLAQPRGFPDDANQTTRYCYERWGSDAHSASWLNAKEIAELERWVAEKFPNQHPLYEWCYLFGGSWGEFATDPKSYRPDGLEDIRFVFWFDN